MKSEKIIDIHHFKVEDISEVRRRRKEIVWPAEEGIIEFHLGCNIGMALAVLLLDRVREKMKEENWWSESLEGEVAKKWEKHGDLILFPSTAFRDGVWRKASPQFWELVCQTLGAKRAARKSGPIKNCDFRRPSVEFLFGNDPWVFKKENHIIYRWDITKCMFSSGNITEKQRISSWDCRGQTVVDLYAGIGYFTLSYLVHAKADLVYACEWNLDAIAALRNNLAINGVEEKCVVLPGNNVEVCPHLVADHVNLGLLPSSEASWEIACKALKRTGGWLHIHENVDCKSNKICKSDVKLQTEENSQVPDATFEFPDVWKNWAVRVVAKMHSILKSLYTNEQWDVKITYIHKVKTYGPHIDHLVLDLHCTLQS